MTASSDKHTTSDWGGALGYDTDDVVMSGNVAFFGEKDCTEERLLNVVCGVSLGWEYGHGN